MKQPSESCPQCGLPVPAAVVSCPACRTSLRAAVEPASEGDETREGLPDSLEAAGGEPEIQIRSTDRPSRIEGFELLKEIGRGGMGVVYLAREEQWGREVALKVVPPGVTPQQVRRFLEEAFTTGQLQHPAIVPLYRMGKTADGRDYYTMKRVQGQTLAQILKAVRQGDAKIIEQFSIRRRVSILLSACEGVAFAHDRGVIHRDLKPSNIMVGDYGEVYVLDWGLAKILFGLPHPDGVPDLSRISRPSRSGKAAGKKDKKRGKAAERSKDVTPRLVSGTPAYMSPEQARGDRLAGPRSDVWSLGAILYQILTLHPPIRGRTAQEMLENAARGEIIPPEEFPEGRQAPSELLDIVSKALLKNASERYASARRMAEDLRAYLDGRGCWQLAYEWQVADRSLPAEDWVQVLGQWRVDKKGLFPVARTGVGAVLLTTRHFLNDVRVELTGFCDPASTEGGELSVFLAAPEPEFGVNESDGYCLQVGADWNTTVKICRDDVEVAVRSDICLRNSERYLLRAERTGDRLRLELNGEELLAFDDLFPLGGSRVGLYGYGDGARVDSIRIYRRAMDAVVSCLAVPDHDFNRGRHAEALAGYRRIAKELSGREEGWMAQFKAGLSRLEAADPLGAEIEFARLDGTSGEALAHLGRSLLSQREGDTRRELLRLGAARRLGAGTRTQGYVLARLWTRAGELHEQGHYESAITFYQEALALEPEGAMRRAQALQAICEAHFNLGRDREALKTLDHMAQELAGFEKKRRAVLSQAIHYFCDAAKWKQALALSKRLESMNQAEVHACTVRARIECLRGHHAAANRMLARGRKLNPRPVDRLALLAGQAEINRDQGKLDAALQCFNEALAISLPDPSDRLETGKAWLLAMQGRFDEALAILAARLKHNAHRSRMNVLVEIGRLSWMQKQLGQARDCFEQVLANLPRSSTQLRIRGTFHLGLVRLAAGDAEGARMELQRTAEAPERNVHVCLAKSLLDWPPGEPLPEPPDPGRECPWASRPLFFFWLGEYARLLENREGAVRAYHRAAIEAPSPWRPGAWMALLRLNEMGETVPARLPKFAVLK